MLNTVQLTDLEKTLARHVTAGTVFDLAPDAADDTIDATVMGSWDTQHEIRAEVIRDILRGRHLPAGGADPHGLQLRGAKIIGRLDLDHLISPMRLSLNSCHLPDGVNGGSCQLPDLDLSWSVFEVTDQNASDGAVRLLGAQIAGQLGLRGATLTNGTGPALYADGISVGGGMFLDAGFAATGHGDGGAVRLPGAQIAGQLSFNGATLTNETGAALIADVMNVGGGMFLTAGFAATGHGDDGAVRLSGATIAGQLILSGATLTNETGPALYADGVSVGGAAFLDAGFTATGHGNGGAVRLLGTQITGELSLHGAILTNETGPALGADRVSVGGNVFLDAGFTATGHGDDGAVRLLGAQITGQLSFNGATLTNETGAALIADAMNVGGNVFFNVGFVATGRGDNGAVRLPGTQITGELSLRGASLTNETGPALYADGVSVGDGLSLTAGFVATGHGDDGAVRLLGARVTGGLWVAEKTVGRAIVGTGWVVDGLTYDRYPTASFTRWLDFLRDGTTSYAAQPYQQLAAVARAAGHDADARRALIAQRDDQVKRGTLAGFAKAWVRFTKFALGYGYQPWRALIGVVGILLIATLLTSFVPGALAVVTTSSQHKLISTPCTSIQRFQIAVDMTIPLVSTSVGSPCRLTSTAGGQIVAWIGIFLTFIGWALTALFAAGFTRAIRQT